ncbi:helix-turn-helix domain-containing protein [Flammeovirga pacifica]|uniref:HTH araC/xylS-type domain-containing protein n=1 Tax=Flammeovirga pacifica TaxID=915059 RepID=A0A1S1YSZ7_FLAPC|nr:AraC family transcriptional regulator [Flammeovirga pacifica]OHX64149.1 hypothetical protein NH26_21325 [Flammeovirga pacifica]
MEESIFSLSGDELNPMINFSSIQKKWGGVLTENNFRLNNPEIGKVESVFFKYIPGMTCGFTSIKLKKSFVYNNHSKDGEKFISLRIGIPGTFQSNHQSEVRIKKSLYLYNSRQSFSIKYPKNIEMKWYFVRFPIDVYHLFADENEKKIFDLINNDKPWFYYTILDHKLEQILLSLESYENQPELIRGILLSKMLEIFTILKTYTSKGEFNNIVYNVHQDDLNMMLQLKEELLQDLAISPNIKEISKSLGMSESKLQRIFKKVFKVPILKFFNEQRLIEAKNQVLFSNKALSEIAFELGFNDLTHFSKRYTEKYGERPSATRLNK